MQNLSGKPRLRKFKGQWLCVGAGAFGYAPDMHAAYAGWRLQRTMQRLGEESKSRLDALRDQTVIEKYPHRTVPITLDYDPLVKHGFTRPEAPSPWARLANRFIWRKKP